METILIFIAPDVTREYTAGKDGCKKIFVDKDDNDTIVILMDKNIVKYRGVAWEATQSYKD